MKIKKHLIATALAFLLAVPHNSQQAQAKNIAESMNAMWNTTNPSFNKNGVNGAYSGSLGGMTVRNPIRNISIVSFDPPNFEAGCGGIDPYFGSFSLISKDNIKAALEAIISNAAGYALKLALENVCSSCGRIAGELQDLTQKISVDSYNTCQIGMAAVDWIRGAKNPGEKNSESEQENMEKANSSGSEDIHSARMKVRTQGGKANRESNADKKDTKYGNNLLNTYISAGVFDTGSNGFDTSIFGGNKEFFEIAMSLIGTNIMTTGSNKDKTDYYVEPIWNFQHLVEGTPTGSSLTILTCSDGVGNLSSADTNKCQKVKHKTNPWQGTERYVIELLVGKQTKFEGAGTDGDLIISEITADSIINYVRNPKTVQLDGTKKQFLASLSPLDKEILSQIAKLDDQAIISASKTLSGTYAKHLAAHLALSIVQETRRAYSTNLNKKRAELSNNQKLALEKLEYDAKKVLADNLKERETLKNLVGELVRLSQATR
ncbi:MAG: conjugal transfer protein TraH [Neisseriaceae bacterium]|nr:conjugal transfer protein TraH [Neisseriaceae bacterium]MBQ9724316.1 conjugal transfer protein TraH [Neisseriaceae bacterium]